MRLPWPLQKAESGTAEAAKPCAEAAQHIPQGSTHKLIPWTVLPMAGDWELKTLRNLFIVFSPIIAVNAILEPITVSKCAVLRKEVNLHPCQKTKHMKGCSSTKQSQ